MEKAYFIYDEKISWGFVKAETPTKAKEILFKKTIETETSLTWSKVVEGFKAKRIMVLDKFDFDFVDSRDIGEGKKTADLEEVEKHFKKNYHKRRGRLARFIKAFKDKMKKKINYKHLKLNLVNLTLEEFVKILINPINRKVRRIVKNKLYELNSNEIKEILSRPIIDEKTEKFIIDRVYANAIESGYNYTWEETFKLDAEEAFEIGKNKFSIDRLSYLSKNAEIEKIRKEASKILKKKSEFNYKDYIKKENGGVGDE